MKLKITVCFILEDEPGEKNLAELYFSAAKADKHASLEIPESLVQLPDGTGVVVSARYSPSNTGTSIVVWRNSKQLALLLAPWNKCAPYLGLQIEGAGFLHLYCQGQLEEN